MTSNDHDDGGYVKILIGHWMDKGPTMTWNQDR